jgi:hypothetical protein
VASPSNDNNENSVTYVPPNALSTLLALRLSPGASLRMGEGGRCLRHHLRILWSNDCEPGEVHANLWLPEFRALGGNMMVQELWGGGT